MRAALILLIALLDVSAARAGVQQDFFVATVQHATRVKIVKLGPERTKSGARQQHVMLDTTERKMVEKVASCIAMIDPHPDGEVWTGSSLTFGVPDYTLDFFQGDQGILTYKMDEDLDFVTPYGGPHAPQGTDMILDFRLTPKSIQSLKELITNLNEIPPT